MLGCVGGEKASPRPAPAPGFVPPVGPGALLLLRDDAPDAAGSGPTKTGAGLRESQAGAGTRPES